MPQRHGVELADDGPGRRQPCRHGSRQHGGAGIAAALQRARRPVAEAVKDFRGALSRMMPALEVSMTDRPAPARTRRTGCAPAPGLAEREDGSARQPRAGKGAPDVLEHGRQAEGRHADEHGQRRARVDAQQARLRQGIAGDGLHERAGHAQCHAGQDGHHGAGHAQQADDQVLVITQVRSPQRAEDVGQRNVARADGDAEHGDDGQRQQPACKAQPTPAVQGDREEERGEERWAGRATAPWSRARMAQRKWLATASTICCPE